NRPAATTGRHTSCAASAPATPEGVPLPRGCRDRSARAAVAWPGSLDSSCGGRGPAGACRQTSEGRRHRGAVPRCQRGRVMSSQVSTPLPFGHQVGTSAAEHLSPAFPERAARGTADKLRAWQEEALDAYFEREPRDFLAAATPGAGKTTFALRLAAELLARKTIDRITVVAPTEHLKRQWADAAHRVGIRLDPGFKNSHGRQARHYHGVAVSYAQVATRPAVHRKLTEGARTLVILDEVHHGGDALSWGDAIRESFEPATRRLSLTGTPFRSDTSPIPFVTYYPDEHGIRTSRADYSYGYGRALKDGVVRPVMFMAYAGKVRWRTRTGDEMEARLGEGDTKDVTAQAWRTALDPEGEWMPSVLRSADRRLSEVRAAVPDAGGLVIATDHFAARAYAELLKAITGRMRANCELLQVVRALDRRGAHGLGGRRHPTPRSGRLRDLRIDTALLRAGDRSLRAHEAPRRDRVHLRAQRAEHPSPGQPDGARARPRARSGNGGTAPRRPARGGGEQLGIRV